MDRFPALEAAPIVFASGADLIGKSEAVSPTLLLRAPAAIPHELVNSCLARGVDLDCSDEVRATRSAAQRDALDRKMGLDCEHVREKPPDFDRRRVSVDANVIRVAAGAITLDGALERFRGSRLREDLFQIAQVVSSERKSAGVPVSHNIVTKARKLKCLALFTKMADGIMLQSAPAVSPPSH